MLQVARRLIARTVGKPFDNYALQLLGGARTDALPWTSSAPRPGLLRCLLNDIRINRRDTIVEFGSGLSTLVIGGALDPQAQRLISFEHHEEWAKYVSEQLEAQGLAGHCKIIHAPLALCEYSMDASAWYDIDIVHESLESLKVDVIVCDGPPAYSADQEMARYPAIPVLHAFLADRFSVYLDDIDRTGERKIAKLWADELQIPFSYQLLRGSFAVGARGEHFNSLM